MVTLNADDMTPVINACGARRGQLGSVIRIIEAGRNPRSWSSSSPRSAAPGTEPGSPSSPPALCECLTSRRHQSGGPSSYGQALLTLS